MTFPDSKFIDTGNYANTYFNGITAAPATIDRARMAQAADILTEVYTEGGIVYSCAKRGEFQTVEILGGTFDYSGYSHVETLFK
jgi:hypothetical protein